MYYPTVENRIVEVLKSSGADFKRAHEGEFLKSKLFLTQNEAESVLTAIQNNMQLSFISVEADPNNNGWFIAYNANRQVRNQFPVEAPPQVGEDRVLKR